MLNCSRTCRRKLSFFSIRLSDQSMLLVPNYSSALSLDIWQLSSTTFKISDSLYSSTNCLIVLPYGHCLVCVGRYV